MVSAAFPNRPFDLRDNVWFISTDVVNNRSRVGWQLFVDQKSSYRTNSGGKAHRWMKLDGAYVHESYGNGFDFNGGNGAAHLIASGEAWINHNADGTKSLLIEAAADFDILGATALVVAINLPSIPRTSNWTFTSGTDVYTAGNALAVTINRASTSFTHRFQVIFGGYNQTIATGIATSYSWTIPMVMLEQIPNAATGVGTIRVVTVNSAGTVIGYVDRSFRINAPASVVPSFTTVTVAEATPGVAANIGAFVQGISSLALAITGAASSGYGATLNANSYKIIVAGQTINSVSGISTHIMGSGTIPVVGTVTDSRGRSVSKTINVTVLPWNPPFIDQPAIKVERALANGTVDEDEGTYLKVTVKGSITSLLNGTQRNQLRYRVSTRLRGAETWTLKTNTLLGIGTLAINTSVLHSGYPLLQAFDILVEISDDFATSAIQLTVGVAEIFMHWDGAAGVGIGKYRQYGRLDIEGDIYHRTGAIVEPAGSVIAFAGPNAPQGWLLCDGSEVSRVTYAALFLVLGITYGPGNGTTTFNVPNLLGRVPMGRDETQPEFDVLGETGGAKTHSHFEMMGYDGNGLFMRPENQSPGTKVVTTSRGLIVAGSTSTSTARFNRTENEPSLPPYLALNFIIKA